MAYDQMLLVADFGIPQTITATATGSITAGDFVKLGSSSNSLGSRVSTFAGTEILCSADSTSGADGPCGGIAAQTVTSGEVVALYRKGVFIGKATGAQSQGNAVASTTSGGTDIGACVGAVADGEEERAIGKLLTAGGDDEFVLFELNL
jgi:hypothetical protein